MSGSVATLIRVAGVRACMRERETMDDGGGTGGHCARSTSVVKFWTTPTQSALNFTSLHLCPSYTVLLDLQCLSCDMTNPDFCIGGFVGP